MPKIDGPAVGTCTGVVAEERCWCTSFVQGGKQRKKCQDCKHAESSHPTSRRDRQALSEKCRGVIGNARCECPVFVHNAAKSTCDDCGHTKGAHLEKTNSVNAMQVTDNVIKSLNRQGLEKLTARTSTEVAIRETNAGLKRTPLDIEVLTGQTKVGSTKFKSFKKRLPKLSKPGSHENAVRIGVLVLLPMGRPINGIWKVPSGRLVNRLRDCKLYLDHTDLNAEVQNFLQFQLSWNTEQIDLELIRRAFPEAVQYLDTKYPLKKAGRVQWLLLEKNHPVRELIVRKEGDPNITGKDLDEAKWGKRRKIEERTLYFGTKKPIPPDVYLQWGSNLTLSGSDDEDGEPEAKDSDKESSSCQSDASLKSETNDEVENGKDLKGKHKIRIRPLKHDKGKSRAKTWTPSPESDSDSEKGSCNSPDLEECQRQLDKLESKLAQKKAKHRDSRQKLGEVAKLRGSEQPPLFLATDDEPIHASGVHSNNDNLDKLDRHDIRRNKRKSADLTSAIVKVEPEVIELSDSASDEEHKPVYAPLSPLLRKRAKHEKGQGGTNTSQVVGNQFNYDIPVNDPFPLNDDFNDLFPINDVNDPFADWRAPSPVITAPYSSIASAGSMEHLPNQLSTTSISDIHTRSNRYSESSYAARSQAQAGPGPSTLANAAGQGHNFLLKIPKSNSRLWN